MKFLNLISENAMGDAKAFYQRQVSDGARGNALCAAHLNLGLIDWCFGDASLSEAATKDLKRAVTAAITALCDTPTTPKCDDLRAFEFTMPLYLTVIFGTTEERAALASLQKTQWLTQQEQEFSSYAALMDLIRRHALDLLAESAEIQEVQHLNEHPSTHDFYQPWIAAMCRGFTCIIERDSAGLETQCEELVRLLQHEAIYGQWTHESQSLMAFWPMVLMVFARGQKMPVNIKSDYIPDNLFR